MRIDYNVDLVRQKPGGTQVFEQFGGLTEDLCHLVRKFVADAGLDEDVLFAGADKHGVQASGDAVFVIGGDLARPQGFWNDAEEGPAIEEIVAVGERGEFKVADGDSLHAIEIVSVQSKSF